MVDVHYDLSGGSGSVRIELTFSNDDGQTWNVIPTPHMLSGDVGNNIPNGTNRHIVWDAGRDRAESHWPQTRARVRASETGRTTTYMLPGGVHLEMVTIPSGSFEMGSGLDPDWSRENEAPQRIVTIDYEFQIGKFQITQEQWYAVMGTFPYYQDKLDNDRPVQPDIRRGFPTSRNSPHGLRVGRFGLLSALV